MISSRILKDESQKLTDPGKDIFGRMQNSAKIMQTLIEDLLTYFTTSTTGKRFENCELKDIVDEVKGELQDELLQKNAEVEIFGECNLSLILFQFRQLIYNLVSNSLKFAQLNIASRIVITFKKVLGATLKMKILLQTCTIGISVLQITVLVLKSNTARIFLKFFSACMVRKNMLG